MGKYPYKVLGLSGEYRPTSKCGMLVNHALNIAESLGAEVHFWDLDVKPLPIVGEEGCWENDISEFDCDPRNNCIARHLQRFFVPEFLFAEIETQVMNQLLNTMKVPAEDSDNKININR